MRPHVCAAGQVHQAPGQGHRDPQSGAQPVEAEGPLHVRPDAAHAEADLRRGEDTDEGPAGGQQGNLLRPARPGAHGRGTALGRPPRATHGRDGHARPAHVPRGADAARRAGGGHGLRHRPQAAEQPPGDAATGGEGSLRASAHGAVPGGVPRAAGHGAERNELPRPGGAARGDRGAGRRTGGPRGRGAGARGVVGPGGRGAGQRPGAFPLWVQGPARRLAAHKRALRLAGQGVHQAAVEVAG
mmetsp:Transcript_71498/g.197437  ORF Transcript_71498/g.197437 Transcript_71498/m.197437 type:complete len:243 (-) Transcript_71498:500-1228(-)